MTFGQLKVIADAPKGEHPCGRKYRRVECICSCGNKTVKALCDIMRGHILTCGHCGFEEKPPPTHYNKKHYRTYNAWRSMITRCTNKSYKTYKYYGGRGIRICERWFDFKNFLADLGECPDGMTIGRINNDGNYCPENVRWETIKQQLRNTSRNRIVCVRGIKGCVTEVCEHFGLNANAVNGRLYLGWDVERAFFTPVKSRKC